MKIMKIILPSLVLVAISAILSFVYFSAKDRTPQHGTVTAVHFTNITFGSRTMSVKEFKAEHEQLASYIVKLLVVLDTNHVVIDRPSLGTNWVLRIMENPENTNQMTVSYEL